MNSVIYWVLHRQYPYSSETSHQVVSRIFHCNFLRTAFCRPKQWHKWTRNSHWSQNDVVWYNVHSGYYLSGQSCLPHVDGSDQPSWLHIKRWVTFWWTNDLTSYKLGCHRAIESIRICKLTRAIQFCRLDIGQYSRNQLTAVTLQEMCGWSMQLCSVCTAYWKTSADQ